MGILTDEGIERWAVDETDCGFEQSVRKECRCSDMDNRSG